MAKKTKPKVVNLTPTSAAALLGGEGPPHGLAGSKARGAGAKSVRVPSLRDLEEYSPPPLPAVPGISFRTKAAIPKAVPPVPISYDVERQTWLLLSNYSISFEGNRLIAKGGYAFDLSSIPRPLWWLIAPNELSIVAPLFHDLLYEFRGRLASDQVNPYRTYTRLETDNLFLHLMEIEGVDWWRRMAAYSAVRAAGGIYWAT